MKHHRVNTWVAGLILLSLLLGGAWPTAAQEQDRASGGPAPDLSSQAGLITRLQQVTDGRVEISFHAQTGQVRYVGTDLGHPIPRPAVLGSEATPEQAARSFLSVYGSLFGLTDAAGELSTMRTVERDRGRSFVRFQQLYRDIPVFGGELIVQMDAGQNVVSANGEILPGLDLDVTPRLTGAEAQQRAIAAVAKAYDLAAGDMVAGEAELWIYNPILLQPGPDLDALVWRVEVTASDLRPVRELVLVEAHTGLIALHFSQVDTARYRQIYDNQNNPAYGLPGNGPVRVEGGGPTGIPDVDLAYDYSGDTYDFFWSHYGRDSLDGAGMSLVNTVRYCPDAANCPYPNAFWNGQQMVFGESYAAADDVVGHELTHGVTDYESHLYYFWQSGALSESFSDVWGEFIDLTNGAGDDTPGVRWLMGEDLPIGALRDMENPPAYQQPDRMGNSTYYYCGPQDNGGVHTNSGVGNKAAFLLVDGGSFNGYTVSPLGLDKTALIWYEVETNLTTSAADYADLYDGLRQACSNLTGMGGITPADCVEVTDAVNATQMNVQPAGCPATEAPVCNTGVPINVWFDDLENPYSGWWTHSASVGSDSWYYPQTSNPYGYDATYATSGVYNFWGYNQSSIADANMRMTSGAVLPANAYLRFDHAYDFEANYDGGVLEYSTNAGVTWNDAGSLIINNPYNGTLPSDFGNPLGGREAFTGSSNGYFSSRANLASLAGQTVRFRFRIGTDSSQDAWGWFIDDVRIYTCQTIVYDHRVYLPIVQKRFQSTPAGVLWNQPLSTVNVAAYVDQEFPDSPSYSSFLADDFSNLSTWQISTIFVPGDGWNGFSSLLNATALTWQIYADNGGVPAGHPGGGAPYWSLTLLPTDSRVTLGYGTPGGFLSNTTLNLSSPISLPAGHWWLVFYPTMLFSSDGQYGRQPADTTNLGIGEFINPGGGFGYGTNWQAWTVVGPTQHDIAFRLEGTMGAR